MSIGIVLLYNPTIPLLRNIHSSGINVSISLKKKFKMISTAFEQGILVETPTLMQLYFILMTATVNKWETNADKLQTVLTCKIQLSSSAILRPG